MKKRTWEHNVKTTVKYFHYCPLREAGMLILSFATISKECFYENPSVSLDSTIGVH